MSADRNRPTATKNTMAAMSSLVFAFMRGSCTMRGHNALSRLGGYGRGGLGRAGVYRVYADPADMLAHLDEIGIRRRSLAADT